MKKININGTEYKLKFGYLSVASSGIIKDVLDMTDKLKEVKDNENTMYEVVETVMPLVGRIALAGLQRYHDDEFGVDYDDKDDVKAKLKKVFRLLDDYFDPEDGEPEESAIEIFWDFASELRDSGFLSGKQEEVTEAEVVAEQIKQIPQDHKKPEKHNS